MARGQTKERLRALRKKFKLGEFSTKARRPKRRSKAIATSSTRRSTRRTAAQPRIASAYWGRP